MSERILFHACAASISCGVSRISRRVSDISLRNLPGCESIRPKSKSIFFVPACQKRPPLCRGGLFWRRRWDSKGRPGRSPGKKVRGGSDRISANTRYINTAAETGNPNLCRCIYLVTSCERRPMGLSAIKAPHPALPPRRRTGGTGPLHWPFRSASSTGGTWRPLPR